MMNIAVVGQGFVGLTLSVFLSSKKLKVYGVENNKNKLKILQNDKSPFFEPNLDKNLKKCLKLKTLQFVESLDSIFPKIDVVYICVPTPNRNNSIDLKFINNVISEIGDLLKSTKKKPMIIIKSTVAPQTTISLLKILSKKSNKILGLDYFLIVNPEFLREGSALEDQMNPHLIVMGCEDPKSQYKIKNFYKKLYSEKIPRNYTNFSTAELIKYSNNAFLATKISFINSISNLCEKIPGANIDDVANAIGADPRIGSLFLKAGPGFGGSCLPKDLNSFISVHKNFGIQPTLLSSVKNVNEKQYDQIISILKKRYKKLRGKTISILGISFKENSDDLRESRSIILIKQLLNENCKIKVYDSLALHNAEKLFKNKIDYCHSINECSKNSDCLIIMNADDEFKKITHKHILAMNKKFIIDTRRILKISNVEYVALGKNSKNS
ncbi:nucleotide sugar dehydrogenase [Nitrosopumilus sp.]|nr:nucleotide sugar dehydrogenase [Nitrosopumilus sp.]